MLLVLAACGASSSSVQRATSPAPNTAAIATVATTAPPPPTWPLTGQLAGAAPITQPVLVVKIDNVAEAHPQSGINQADVVYEELVENSSTRLMAIFHSTDAAPIGPVRSARPTDVL